MTPVNSHIVEEIVSLLVNGTPGNTVYIGRDANHAKTIKAAIDDRMKEAKALSPIIQSLRQMIVTDTQRFLFTSARAVTNHGALRGWSLHRVYLDINDADRVELLPIILPAVTYNQGQVF